MILTTSKFERLVKNRVSSGMMMVQNVSLEKIWHRSRLISHTSRTDQPLFLYNTLEYPWQALNEGNG